MKKIRRTVALLLSVAIITAFAGCEKEITAKDLMEDITPSNASEVYLDEDFRTAYSRTAFRMLENEYSADGGNVVLSPLSMLYNLALLGNGAYGETQTELEKIMGSSLSIQSLNTNMHSFAESLHDSDFAKLYFDNAIWFNADQNAQPTNDFLQVAADYYSVSAYKESFNADTVTNVNNWISNKTNMNVEYVIDKMPSDVPMYMFSAAMLEASWATPYSYDNIQDGVFVNASGVEEKAQMMTSFEYQYIKDAAAHGIIKEYSGKDYAFVAVLPDEGVSVEEYVKYLASGENYKKLMESEYRVVVDATVPKFSCQYNDDITDLIKAFDLGTAFNADRADLRNLGTADGNLYVGGLQVRTAMSVTDKGTSKGTSSTVANENANATSVRVLTLDRPFVFAVIDCQYKLPVILGAINSVAE